MMDIQFLTMLYLGYAAMLAGVFVTLASGTTLPVPVRTVVRIFTTTPKRVVRADVVLSHARQVTKRFLRVLPALAKFDVHIFAAISTRPLDTLVLCIAIALSRAITLSIDPVRKNIHLFAALGAINLNPFGVIGMLFPTNNIKRFFWGMNRLPGVVTLLGAELAATCLNLIPGCMERFAALFATAINSLGVEATLIAAKLTPSHFDPVRRTSEVFAALFTSQMNTGFHCTT